MPSPLGIVYAVFALIGHLIDGTTTAIVFLLLDKRRAAEQRTNAVTPPRAEDEMQTRASTAPALCVFLLGLGLLLPILLG